MKKFKKGNKGITLIALVITIIILLILAGLTISSLTGSGLFEKAGDAEIRTRASSVEEQVTLWKGENFASNYTKDEKISAEKMLEDLKTKKLVYEEEIDRENEIITIKKKDGTIVKEIPYGEIDVKINISKTPEIEISGYVELEVTSVEGLGERFITKEELEQRIAKMKDSEKRELYKNVDMKDWGDGFTKFEDLLQYLYEEGDIESATEESYWKMSEEEGYYNDEAIINLISYYYYNEDTGKIKAYEIINPEGEIKDIYIAVKNRVYTFTVKDIFTGKTYTKSIEVTNIDERYYVGNQIGFEIFKDEGKIVLYDSELDPTFPYAEFEEAYIIINGEEIDISDEIRNTGDYSYLTGWFAEDRWFIEETGYNLAEFMNTDQIFILVKDGIEYYGQANIGILEPQ